MKITNDKTRLFGHRGWTAAGLALAVAASFAALTAPAAAHAAYFGAGKDVAVKGTTSIAQNVYAAGADVAVASPVQGDVLAVGSTLSISSKVSGDIFAVGSNVSIEGASAQDVRAAAANLSIDGAFSGELLAAGASVTVTPATTIVKDSYIAGKSITFDGADSGSLYLTGGTVYFDGATGGNLTIRNAQAVSIGPDAVIGGALDYAAQAPATIAEGAHIAGVTTFSQIAARQKHHAWAGPFAVLLTLFWLIKFLIVLTAAYLFWYIFHKDAVEAVSHAARGFWKELLRGFIVAVALPVAAIIVLFTVIGAIPAVLALIAYAALLIAAAPVTGIVTAALIWHRRHTDLRWYHIFLGVLIIELVALIPFVGWIVALAVYLASFGALAAMFWSRIIKRG